MTEALLDHQGTVSIGGRTITNLRLADDIDGLAGTEEELGKLVKRFDDTSSKFGMEINAEKTKLMTNTSQPLTNKITLNGQELEAVSQFKYLGAIMNEKGSHTEVISRAAHTAKAMANSSQCGKTRRSV
ncbi:uncharacterized protein [Diadema antillarum]|uniref:uncharacterized protein n=1 Tax=Diadema antillarum TaxID=105358 RepID=UPI003A8779CD